VAEPPPPPWTRSAAEPLTPLAVVAVMVAEPAATAEATPLPLTVATAGLLLAQVKAVPAISWPFASNALAVNAWVDPTVTVSLTGAMVTEAGWRGSTTGQV